MRSNKSGKAGWWTKERQQYAYDRLTKEAGLSDPGARGLISRWSNVEAHAGPTAKNPTSGAHGIGQWLGDRKKELGGSVDFTVQIDHAIRELNGKEKKAGDLLRNAKTAEEGAIGASAYERAEGYNKRTKRDNFTDDTVRGMQNVAVSTAPQAQGLLASFFSDPLGMQAQAAEAPTSLAAFADPNQAPARSYEDPTSMDMEQGNGTARLDAAFARAQASPPANVSAQDIARQAVNAPVDAMGGLGSALARGALGMAQSVPDASRFAPGLATPDATPAASRFAPGLQAPQGPVSPEHYASAMSPTEQAANARQLGAEVGAMAGPAPETPSAPMSPDGRVADPFGNYKPGGLVGTATASEMPAEASAFTEQPSSVTTQAMRDSVAVQPGAVAPGLAPPSAPSTVAPAATQFGGLLGTGAANMGLYAYQHPEEAAPTIADPNTEIGPQGQTIAGDFPSSPEEDSIIGPNTKRALTGLMLGGPIGGLLGAASGMLSGGLGSLGGPAGMAGAGERFNAGGITSGMYGQRGATGYSRSQPGVFSVSRGPNQGYDLNNQFGARTTYGPSGDIRANSGTMDAWGRVLGGLFDRPDKDKNKSGGNRGLSQAGRDAVGKGLGGLY